MCGCGACRLQSLINSGDQRQNPTRPLYNFLAVGIICSSSYVEVSMIAYNILSQRAPLCKMHLDNTPSRKKLFFSNTFCEATLSGATSASIRTMLRSLKPTVIAALTASVPYPWPQYFLVITYPSSALQDLAPSPWSKVIEPITLPSTHMALNQRCLATTVLRNSWAEDFDEFTEKLLFYLI